MATLRWTSGAQSVKDIWTLTLSGTVTSQTYTVTIGNKTITYTSDGSATAAVVLLAIYNLWISTTSPVPQEFKELVATVDNATTPTMVTLTGTVSGVPHTVAFTTGGAASPVSTNTVPASGPNFFNVGANWSTGSAPANGDTVVFDAGAVACKYGLSTSLTTLTVQLNPGYSGQLGLPDTNSDATPYHEYRTASLTITGGTLIVNAPSVNLCRVDFGSTLATVRVLNSGNGIDGAPAVLVVGGAASSEADITKGTFAAAYYAGTSANFPTVKQSFVNNQNSDSTVILGVGCSTTTFSKTGGAATVYCALTTFTQSISGGSVTFMSGAVTTLNANGGVADYRSNATITTLNIHNDAQVSFDADPRAMTVTNSVVMVGRSCSISDGQKRLNSGVLTLTMTDATLDQVQHGTSNSAVIT